MPESIPAALRGIILRDPRSVLDRENTTATEAGPIAGIPVPAGSSPLVLSSAGDLEEGLELTVETVRGGYPDGSRSTFSYTPAGGTRRGFDGPSQITAGILSFSSFDVPGDVTDAGQFSALALPGGYRAVAWCFENVDQAETAVCIEIIDPAGGFQHFELERWTSTSISPFPALVLLPDGRVRLYFWKLSGGSSSASIFGYISSSGSPWLEWLSTGPALSAPLNMDISRQISAAAADGQVLLLAHYQIDDVDVIAQWGSDDDGETFIPAGELRDYAGFPLALLSRGRFVVLYAQGVPDQNLSPVYVSSPLLGDAFQPVQSSPYVLISGAYIGNTKGPPSELLDHNPPYTSYHWTGCVDDDGTIYALWREWETGNVYGARSIDSGSTWVGLASASASPSQAGPIFASGDPDIFPENLAAAMSRGRVWVFCTGAGKYVRAILLGGWTTLPEEHLSGAAADDAGQLPADHSWIFVDDLESFGWTAEGTGSTSNDDNLTTERITHGGDGFALVRSIPTGEGPFKIDLEIGEIESTDGDSVQLVRIEMTDGAEEMGLEVRWYSDGTLRIKDLNFIRFFDVPASASGWWALRLYLDWTERTLWYSWASIPASTGTVEEVREYSSPDSFLLRRMTGTASGVRIGCIDSATNFQAMKVRRIDWGYGSNAGPRPGTSINGRAYSSSQCYLERGLSIQAERGPTRTGDSWLLPLEYKYGLDELARPSPADYWEGTSTDEETIGYSIGDTPSGSPPALAVVLQGHNWRTGALELYTGTEWIEVLEIDTAVELADLVFQRHGDALVFTAGSSRWVDRGELEGGWAVSGTAAARILWNSAGRAPDGGLLVRLDNPAGFPSSGTLALCPPRFLGIAVFDEVPIFQRYRIRIDAQPSPDAAWRAGTLEIGPFVPFGQQYGRGWSAKTETNVDLDTNESGRRRATVRGPARRIYSLAWAESPLPVEDLRSASPYHVAAYPGGVPLAFLGAVPGDMEGLIRELDGAALPATLVLDARFSATGREGSGPTAVYQARTSARDAFCFGRCTGTLTREQVTGGRDSQGGYWRIAALTWEEEV